MVILVVYILGQLSLARCRFKKKYPKQIYLRVEENKGEMKIEQKLKSAIIQLKIKSRAQRSKRFQKAKIFSKKDFPKLKIYFT